MTEANYEDKEVMLFGDFVRALRQGVFSDDDGYMVIFSPMTSSAEERIILFPSQLSSLMVEWVNK